MEALRAACKRHPKSDQAIHALETLDEIAGRTPPPPPLKIDAGEAWADAVISDLSDVGPAERAADELGLSPLTAVALQKVARDELAGCAEAVCPVTGETAAGSGGHRLDADTPIEEIADDPSARAALARIIPRLFNHPSYEQFKSLSLRQLQPLSGGMIGPDDLERAEMALRAAKGG